MEWTYVAAVEKMLGTEVPRRGELIRIMTAELQRIASHLMAFGTYALDLGAFSPFLYAFEEREKILRLFEEVSGARLLYNYIWVGGVWNDWTDEQLARVSAFCDTMEEEAKNEEIEEIEEVETEKPKKKREVTEAMKEHLATIRIKALKVKAERKELREKAKQLENAELQLKADKYDKAVEEKNKLKTPPKQEIKEEVEEVVEEVKPKKVKKVIKKVVEESESEEEIVEQVIIKKKSNNKPLTNNEKLKLVEQTAEERLKESLKNDRLNYLLNQIGAKL
jgi:Ni,Fe-hydrogenase I large subunit